MKTLPWQEALPLMSVGDVIAFSGVGRISNLVRWATRSWISGAKGVGVSHVSVIFAAGSPLLGGHPPEPILMESTSISYDGQKGVRIRLAGVVIEKTAANAVWWLPLSKKSQDRMLPERFIRRLGSNNRKDYGYLAAIAAGIGLPAIFCSSNKFCSELIVEGYQEGNVLPSWFRPAGVDPKELIGMKLWADPVQIKGFELGGVGEVELEGVGEKDPWQVTL